MRVTERHMIELAAEAAGSRRADANEAGKTAMSGLRVHKPSDDRAAWAEGARAAAREKMSAGRSTAIARSLDRLTQADQVLGNIGDALSRARELAVQMANETLSASDRATAAIEVTSLRTSALAAANSRDNRGEFIFAGTEGQAEPFDAGGVYVGDTVGRSIEVGEGESQQVTVSGQNMTAAGGVDVFATLAALATALTANDPAGVRTALGGIESATRQVGETRSEVGQRQRNLESADEARENFDLRLAETRANAVEADPIRATLDLTQTKGALETAYAIAQEIITMVRQR